MTINRKRNRAMSLGNPLLTDDSGYSLDSTRAIIESFSTRNNGRSNTFTSDEDARAPDKRKISLPVEQTELSEENIRRFATKSYGGYVNIGDSRRRSIRKSSLISSSTTEGSTGSKVEMEILELENGSVKRITVYHIIILGYPDVGKHSVLRQFASSEYRGIYSFNTQSGNKPSIFIS
ncbi:hypothetical protein GJ496_009043 [Pomphorhynchus laevis]|nr:hypothetical protein GJ496_009043 [Pomphorhynchus laevis]